MEAYWDIVEQLDMYCCPRCMAVAYGDIPAWSFVVVDDVTDFVDVVCPDCVTEYDLTRPELAERLEQIDTALGELLA